MLAALLCCMPILALAQASVVGTVTDPSGASGTPI
jgi:hypothetical protein